MDQFFDEERLRQVLESAKDCRMRQLEKDLEAWPKYVEVLEIRTGLTDQLDKVLPNRAKDLFWLHDDAWALLMAGTQDFFYEQGFTDCLHLLKLTLGKAWKEEE